MSLLLAQIGGSAETRIGSAQELVVSFVVGPASGHNPADQTPATAPVDASGSSYIRVGESRRRRRRQDQHRVESRHGSASGVSFEVQLGPVVGRRGPLHGGAQLVTFEVAVGPARGHRVSVGRMRVEPISVSIGRVSGTARENTDQLERIMDLLAG